MTPYLPFSWQTRGGTWIFFFFFELLMGKIFGAPEVRCSFQWLIPGGVPVLSAPSSTTFTLTQVNLVHSLTKLPPSHKLHLSPKLYYFPIALPPAWTNYLTSIAMGINQHTTVSESTLSYPLNTTSTAASFTIMASLINASTAGVNVGRADSNKVMQEKTCCR